MIILYTIDRLKAIKIKIQGGVKMKVDIFVFVEKRSGFFSSAFLNRVKPVKLTSQIKEVESSFSIKKNDGKKYLVLFLEGRKKNSSITLAIRDCDSCELTGKKVITYHLRDNKKATLVGVILPS
ncbi:MAG: hypothetical protein Q7T79_02010 [bacterium]|nr:hypothetical protein [bacterium]